MRRELQMTVALRLPAHPAPELSMTAAPDPLTTGADLTYTIVVTNNGIGVARDVKVTDELPASLTFVSCAATAGGLCLGTGNNRTVLFSSLPVGASATIILAAMA